MTWCTLDGIEVQSSELKVSPEWGQVHNSDTFGWHTVTGTLLEEDGSDFDAKSLPNGVKYEGLPAIRLRYRGLPEIRLDDRNIP